MLNYKEIIDQFESAYKHMGQCAEQYNRYDIAFWERAGMVSKRDAKLLRYINTNICENHGKFVWNTKGEKKNG